MPSRDLEFQVILKTQIEAGLTAESLAATVTASPQADESYPYIDIGEVDVDDYPVGEGYVATVHVWSDVRGPHEVKQIQSAIYDKLHDKNFSGPNFNFVGVRQQFKTVTLDRDEPLWHGIQRFRFLACT